jgi:hypothetical protein
MHSPHPYRFTSSKPPVIWLGERGLAFGYFGFVCLGGIMMFMTMRFGFWRGVGGEVWHGMEGMEVAL